MCQCEDRPCCGCNSLYELRAPAEPPEYDPAEYHDQPDAEPYYMIEVEEEGETYLVEYMGKFDTREEATEAMNKADWDSAPQVVELY